MFTGEISKSNASNFVRTEPSKPPVDVAFSSQFDEGRKAAEGAGMELLVESAEKQKARI